MKALMPVHLIMALLLLAGPAQAAESQAPPAGAGEGACATAGCHADLIGRAHPHPPAAESGCELCHEHSGGRDHKFRLVTEPVSEVCTTCHDLPSGEGVNRHGALEMGGCTVCHDPHSSDNTSLLQSEVPDLCLTCHEDPTEARENVHGALEMAGCTTCHDPHASSNGPLLTAGVPDLCLSCHEDPRQAGESVHAAAEEGDCTLCHTPHASSHRKLAREEIKDLCTTCHADQAEELAQPQAHVHGVIDSVGCSACHNPHAASAPRLLRSEGIELCTPCHLASTPGAGPGQGDQTTLFGSIDVDSTWLSKLPKITISKGEGHPVGKHPVQGESDPRHPERAFWCISCHEPHSSAREKLLTGPGGMGLCTQCHKK